MIMWYVLLGNLHAINRRFINEIRQDYDWDLARMGYKFKIMILGIKAFKFIVL